MVLYSGYKIEENCYVGDFKWVKIFISKFVRDFKNIIIYVLDFMGFIILVKDLLIFYVEFSEVFDMYKDGSVIEFIDKYLLLLLWKIEEYYELLKIEVKVFKGDEFEKLCVIFRNILYFIWESDKKIKGEFDV